jgi:DNA-binding MarR family transcriptional regulator
VSATVETLVERGYLAREAVDGDRRAIRLAVTAAGHAALDTAQQAMEDRLGVVLGLVPDQGLVKEALDQLHQGLDALRTERRRSRR